MEAIRRQLATSKGRIFEAAQRAIKDYIVLKRLQPGDALPAEARLADELGVGRNSVREAVKALEALGVLECRVGAGVYVRPFTLDPVLDNLAYGLLLERSSILELLDVRGRLEASYIQDVARDADAAHLRVLRSVVDRMGERAARGESFREEDRFFHRTLYARLDHRLLLMLLDLFWDVYSRLLAEVRLVPDADPVRVWEQHRRIVEALECGDADAAREAIEGSLAGSKERLIKATALRLPEGASGGAGTLATSTTSTTSATSASAAKHLCSAGSARRILRSAQNDKVSAS